MLKIYLHDGSHDEFCDYCRKKTGEEVISLALTGRTWAESAAIQVHTRCLNGQLKRLHNPPRAKEAV